MKCKQMINYTKNPPDFSFVGVGLTSDPWLTLTPSLWLFFGFLVAQNEELVETSYRHFTGLVALIDLRTHFSVTSLNVKIKK